MTSPVRGRARRRWRRAALAALLIGAGLVAALPWLLKMPAAQRRLATEANKVLAPSSVEFSEVRLSWFRPTEISNAVLRDAQGDRVVAAPRATFSWGLWQVLVTRPKIAVLTLEQSDVDVERFADGTVDLYETLKPVISEHPRVRLVIRVGSGRLRFRDPAFTDPVVADKADIVLDLGRDDGPITWNLQLARTQGTGEPGLIGIEGSYSRADIGPWGRHDLALALKGTRWPWTLANSLVQARGELTGKLEGRVRAGRVRIDGDATITDLVAVGDALASDTVHFETARAQLGLAGSAGSWTIDKLDVTSPMVSLQGQGSMPPGPDKSAWLEVTVDLAAMARQLPATLHLPDDLRVERGSARVRADIRSAADGHTENWIVAGKVSELAARLGEKTWTLSEPVTLGAKVERDGMTTKLERLDVQTSFLTAKGQGDLDRGVVVTATLDLAAFRERFRDGTNPGGVELAGQGKLEARYQRQGTNYLAGVNAAFRDLRLGGLPLVEKLQRDQLTFEAKIEGAATPSGWPRSWQDVSLHGSSGETDLKLSARAGAAPGEFVASARASAPLNLGGRRHRLEGELTAKSARGAWTADGLAVARARRDQDQWNLGLRFELRDAASTAGDGSKPGLPDSVVMTANAGYAPQSDRLELTELTLKASYFQLEGAGVVRGVTSRADVDLKGSLNPDWRAIQALLAREVEPNARIAGRPRAWRLAGTLDGLPAIDRMGALEGEIGVQIDSLDVFGIRLSAVPVVVRATDGRLTIDPIDSQLNSGGLHLGPELVRGGDGSTWLHLGRESSLEGAVVNDEVSHRVLSFAAPVLDGATRVEGRVSVMLADAYFPVLAPSEARARIEGDVLFDDVRFMPGPLADQLLSVFQRERRPLAVLRDPIAVRIAGRKVYQEGLAIPVGDVASIGIDGSVDFDQNLDLVARVALTLPGSNVPVLTPLLENVKLELPVRGTLKNPKIDGEALKERWKEIGAGLLGDSMEAGVDGLRRLFEGLPARGLRGLIPRLRRPAPPQPDAAGPADGQAPHDLEVPRTDHEVLKPSDRATARPAPLTAGERKKRREDRRKERLRKKADRRARQGPR